MEITAKPRTVEIQWERRVCTTLVISAVSHFLVARLVTSPPAMREASVQSLAWDDPLQKAMATHSSILAWRIPCIRKGLLTKRVFLLMFDLIKNNLYTFQSCMESYIPVTNSFVFSY